MKQEPEHLDKFRQVNKLFFEKAEKAFAELFKLAKAKNELHFALSLTPEFRGVQGPGWNTADETHRAFEDYLNFINKNPDSPFKARVGLAFYCHMAEASGFYEIPKNLMRVAEGNRYNLWPFRSLNKKHKTTGEIIAPNANRVLQDLAGHAKELGLTDLAEIFRDAFDSDLRNGYAHADYVIWNDGVRLPKRNGGTPQIVSWPEFSACFDRGINFFNLLREIVNEQKNYYNPAKEIVGQLAEEPKRTWVIEADPAKGIFSISSKP